ncbi:MAG TPA: YggS family pyridoxal phosphate-dependent enzyme [Ignavibacteriaceae bacterium]|nr:YggS family pyridoxal phosphate-dependent enzyme [Ignavibacteriaceae bacterium]
MIAENLNRLKDKILQKCTELNQEPDKLKLVAVSKFFGIKEITEANRLGITDFGENKAQELRDKYELLGDKVTWHFIGTLQKNKVKYVVNSASYIHSVDSTGLAEEINKQAKKLSKVQKILIEVKTSFEETKSGIAGEDEIFGLAKFCKSLSNLDLIGLMTMAPFTNNQKIIRKSFSDLRNLKDKLNNQGMNLVELSMGMTSDFEIAIEEGATILRIGSAIFGERNYSKDWRQL